MTHKKSLIYLLCFVINHQMAGEGVSLTPPYSFSKNISSKERVKPWFFVTFDITIRHIFPENFIEIPQVVQKLRKIFLPILDIFINL